MNGGAGISAAWLAPHFAELSGLTLMAGGGQKLVFSARHATDGDIVLKLIRPPVDLQGVEREILAVQRVLSARVPRILDHGILPSPLGDCFWLREARVQGETLRQALQRGPLNAPAILQLGLHTLEALVAAEDVSIVHRDVKPENIMKAPGDEFSLLDFGIARHLQLSSHTPTSDRFGKCTPGYAPPEQFKNLKQDIDARSDVFALGVTLYECGTGQNPFIIGAANRLEVLQRVDTQPLPRLVLPIRAANELSDLVAAMTQRRRDHRPATARAVLDWLREIHAREGG